MITNIKANLDLKKIIVSGADGFTGRFVCKELKSEAYHFQ